MNLHDLAKELEGSNWGGFNAKPSQPIAVPDNLYHTRTDPCPDFLDLLPDGLIDPGSGKSVMISQSRLKAWRKVMEDELCPRRFYHTRLIRDEKEETGHSAIMGRRFEYLLTGAPDYDGNIPGPILTAITQVESADEKRIQENAKKGKATLARLGVDLSKSAVSTRFGLGILDGEFDISGNNSILKAQTITDIKYSGLLRDKWHEWGWAGDLRFGAKCQASHYVLIGMLLGFWDNLEDAEFMFVVFDSRKDQEGEYEAIRVKISEEQMNAHKWLILDTVEQIQKKLNGEGFDAIPSYQGCKSCPVKCEKFQAFPEVREEVI